MTAGIICLVLILAALLAIPVSRRLTGDYFSPPTIVCIAWCGTLGLYVLRLLPYEPMTSGTVALIGATIVLLAGGSSIGIWLGTQRRAGARADSDGSERRENDLRLTSRAEAEAVSRAAHAARPLAYPALWTTAYAIIGLAGSGWYVWGVTSVLGPRAFLDGDVIRNALNRGVVPGTFLFLQYFSLASALLAYALWTTGRLRARHLLLPGLCAIGTLITTDRTQSFTLIVTAGFISAYHLGPRLRASKLIAAGVLLPALLIINFVGVGIWRSQSWKMFQTQVSGDASPAPSTPSTPSAAAPSATASKPASVWQGPARQLSMLYFYATASYPALDRIARAERPRTHGALTFYPVVRALERLHIVSGPLPPYIPEFLPVAPAADGGAPMQTNASTFLYYPLEDFGVPGALVYALVVGLAAGFAYAWMRRDRDDEPRLLLASQIATALLLTIFVNKFNNTGWWYVLLLTIAPFITCRSQSIAPRRA